MADAAADRLAMPPPAARPGKRKVVLEEDTYADAIEAIVERDFFPHLPKLQNQLEWLQAVQSGDPAQIKRAQLNIARRRAGLKTPLAHEGAPGTAAITPGTGLLRTPAMTPAVGGPSGSFMPAATPARTPAAAAAASALQEQQGLDPVTAQQQVGAKAPSLSLDQFFSSYEGEDNASFQQLHQKTLERKRAKMVHHLEDKNKPLLLEANVHSTDEYGTSGQTPSTLQMTKHVPKNSLYYDSSQQKPLALTAAEAATIVQGPPKSISYTATRSLTEQQEAAAAAASAAAAAAAAAAAGGELQQSKTAAAAAAAAVAPGTRGYGYMKTPQIMPGVDASPLMTWGDIASTPLRLDTMEEGIEDLTGLGVLPDESGGPVSRQFAMPQVRSREVAAQQMLAGRSAAAAAGRRRGSSATPLLDSLRRGSTPGGSGAGSTPARGGVPLSAAGMKLAQQLKGGGRPATGPRGGSNAAGGGGGAGRPGSSAADLQLRASYMAGGVTPSRGGAAVPGTWDTPGTAGRAARLGTGGSSGSGLQQRPLSGKIHVQPGRGAAKRAGHAAGAAAAGAGAQQQQRPTTNVTDDLLQLG